MDKMFNSGKRFFTNGKLYGTSVRTSGANVNGYGAIAEIYFKIKSDVLENTMLNFSLSDVHQINASGNLSTLSSGNLSVLVDGNTVGLSKENKNELSASFFPNPGSNEISLLSNSKEVVTYKLLTISGQEVVQGKFNASTKVDLTIFQVEPTF